MDKASAGTRLTRLLRLGRGRSSDCSFSRFQAVHDGTRADWARCYRLCLCGWHPMSTLRHTATHFGRASRESKTLRGANDRPFLPGSRRDRRMRGCGLEATNATTRRRFCLFSGAMIQQRPTPMTQTIQNVSDTAFMVAGFRALENERLKPFFRDPLATKLGGDHGKKTLAP